ncbi:conserved hypothetical protein [Cupriavidus taiwanensis LMG 19424]|uniref:Lipoprotein n=2 Tax=Cupriavidus taiwanensis TaxID=164546 RepID=B2AGH7_CUPTR|nr:conserved hypothetical protein [Cupriavidus taiwanensis LMG 19424]
MSVSENILENAGRILGPVFGTGRRRGWQKLAARPAQLPANPCQDSAGGQRASPVPMRGDFNMALSAQPTEVSEFHNCWARRILVILGAAVLCACSAMKLGYQQGDRLAYWWIDNYVDVTSAQEPLTREAIARFFAWHRKAQLPEIASLLEEAKADVRQPVTPAMVAHFQDASQQLARRSFEQAMPDMADFLLTLTPDQIARMEKKFAEGNAKYRKKFLNANPAEREEARFDKVMEYARLVYGGFSPEQEKAIRVKVGPVVQNAEARYAERVARQQEWIKMVRFVQATQPPKAQVIDLLRRFREYWQNPPARHAASHEASNNAGIALTVAIANLTTPQQKTHAQERFQKWIDDTHALMREKANPPVQSAQAN